LLQLFQLPQLPQPQLIYSPPKILERLIQYFAKKYNYYFPNSPALRVKQDHNNELQYFFGSLRPQHSLLKFA